VVDEDRILRLLRSRRLETANGDAVRLLGEHGVLTPALARSVRQAVGFRNVLVHDYIRVNDDLVVDRLKALGDLEDFVSQVADFVTRA
jgi:uncharacterized protein YutE (UPF0331/DUF86 family)